ncbi:MAG: hypothetical protein KatS3mg108_1877 [Isosphaeraceae bacterium]|jgi:endonuclease YncB( thermonuclease family)|nr:MAG: hypothetical protein KatS3mg108_1877 [Isosphaeraceae bacterium]
MSGPAILALQAFTMLVLASSMGPFQQPPLAYGAAPDWQPDPNWKAHHPKPGALLYVLTQFDDRSQRQHPQLHRSALGWRLFRPTVPPVAAPNWAALARFAGEYQTGRQSDLLVLARSGCKPLDFGYPCQARVLGLYAPPSALRQVKAEFPWVKPIRAILPEAANGVYARVQFLEGPLQSEELLVPAFMLTRLIPPDVGLPRPPQTQPAVKASSLKGLAGRFENLGQYELAADFYRRGLVVDPTDHQAKLSLERLGSRVPALSPEAYPVVSVLPEGLVEVVIENRPRAVRLLGLSFNEWPAAPADQPPKPIPGIAAARLRALLQGQAVRLELPLGTDLTPLPAYVYRASDGLDLSRELIDTGHVCASWAEDHPRLDEFRQAAEIAESQQRGIWHPAPPVFEPEGPAPRLPGLTITPAAIEPGGTTVRPPRSR